MKSIFSNKYLRNSVLVIAGILIGWILFHSPKPSKDEHHHSSSEATKSTIWTCSMHPQIRMDHPGKCPICGMDLIPLNQLDSATSVDPDAIQLTKDAAQLANVQTSVITKQKAVKELRLFGKVQADERLLQAQVSHLPGRIEKLMVNFTGEIIRRGQPLAVIYSPDLVTAQQELIEAAKMKQSQPEIYEAAKDKLRQWKLTDNQINTIESSGAVKNDFEIYSNTNGIILNRRVNNGDHIDAGTVLFDVADLSNVWVLFDAYESDLPFLKVGDKLTFSVQALPGVNFSGNITFIDPVVDPVTRVSKVRVEIKNPYGQLKPEMFATGIVNANLQQYANKIVIPRSSVLWTGKRSIVYVKQPNTTEPVFKMREVELGPSLGDSYIVLKGLEEGEEIVTQGTFSVDASAQLQGKPSMMNPEGGNSNTITGMSGMNMSETEIPADKGQGSKQNSKFKGKTTESSLDDINMNFIMQLNKVVDEYFTLKNAFVQSDVKKTKETAKNVQQALTMVDMKLLAGDAHIKWMDILSSINKQISTIISSGNIDEQRSAFSDLTDQLYKSIKLFGMMGKTIYYQFCPMFNNGKGAYWLSETKEIRNPYYGEAMLTCGDTKEVIK